MLRPRESIWTIFATDSAKSEQISWDFYIAYIRLSCTLTICVSAIQLRSERSTTFFVSLEIAAHHTKLCGLPRAARALGRLQDEGTIAKRVKLYDRSKHDMVKCPISQYL